MIMQTNIVIISRRRQTVLTRKIDTFLKVQKEKKTIEY